MILHNVLSEYFKFQVLRAISLPPRQEETADYMIPLILFLLLAPLGSEANSWIRNGSRRNVNIHL